MAVRANQLTDFRGEPYITLPELQSAVSGITTDSLSIKPFTFDAAALETVVVDNVETDAKSIVVPGIVFNVFENGTGIVYGDIEYLSGSDAGKTLVTFADWSEAVQSSGFGANPSFTAMAMVRKDGSPVEVLPSESLQ